MKIILLLTFLILSNLIIYGQDIIIGFKDSIQSIVLNETRRLIVRLPRDYNSSEKHYPVLYRLDGDLDIYAETLGTINRLVYTEESVPDMVVVMVENTDRNRDMMPTNTSFFASVPGADNFKHFIEYELVPFIDSSYRTTNEKLLCGQSLSAIFTIYFFLTSPNSFNSYIAISGGFPECEDYFIELTHGFLKGEQINTTNIFLTHGMTDFLDTEGIIKKQIIDFSQHINSKENLNCELKIYEDEGHVPFQSLYHGLRFIYAVHE